MMAAHRLQILSMKSSVSIASKTTQHRSLTLRRSLWTALRLLLSCAAIAWVLHSIALGGIVAALQSADPLLLTLGVLMNVATRFPAAERTQVMNQGLGLSVSRWQTIETLFISNFYALLSPGPLLAGVVTVYRYRRFGASITGSVSSLLASRAIECAAFVIWGLGCALLDPPVMAHLQSVRIRPGLAAAAVILASIAIAAMVWVAIRHRGRDAATSTVPRGILDKLAAVYEQILAQGPAVALKAALPASLQVLISGGAMMVLSRALHTDISWMAGVWMSSAVYLAVLLPISIAGLGVRDVTLIKSFAILGLAPRTAVALSVLLFLDQFVSAMIGGALQIGSVLARQRPAS
jgi:glycosyltransferase 2 family protein